MKKDKFADILFSDLVVVYDEYSHDYVEHVINVRSIEQDKENVTETNPEGIVAYGRDLTDQNEETMITTVTESNFVRFVTDEEKTGLVAEAILGYCGMGIDAELPHEEHVKSLTEALETCPERLRGWLNYLLDNGFSKEEYDKLEPLKEMNDVPIMQGVPYFNFKKTTEYGTAYGLIAKWVLSFMTHSTEIFDFMDNEFYDFICQDLEKASAVLRYYLSDATENTLQEK